MGKIIAIANQKGGVGKTTTAINLAAALGTKNKKILLVDVDAQGNATSGLGLEKTITPSVYEMMIDGIPASDVTIETEFQNLWVVPAGEGLAGAEIELVLLEDREYRLKKSLSSVKQEFDYIFLDCPPSLGLITLNCLTSADSVLIPLQCEYYALEGLTQLMTNIKRIQKSLNPDIELEGILLTMLDARTNIGLQVVDEIKEHFPGKAYATIIPRNVRLTEAPSYGQPINVYDKNSKGCEAYDNLAEEFLYLAEEG